MKNLTVKLTLIFTLICLGVVDAWAVKTELATYNFTNGTTMPTNVTNNGGAAFATSRFCFDGSGDNIVITPTIPNTATTLYVVVTGLANGSKAGVTTITGLNSSGNPVAGASGSYDQTNGTASNVSQVDNNSVEEEEISFSATDVAKIKIACTTYGNKYIVRRVVISYDTSGGGGGYSITYNCDDATSGCPSNASGQTALPNPLPDAPTKTGYTFAGWYTNAEKTTAAVAGATLTGNVTLYAKWTYSVTLHYKGTSSVVNNLSGTYTLPTTGTEVGNACDEWVFDGWYSNTYGEPTASESQPTYITQMTAPGNAYAVYKHTEGGSGSIYSKTPSSSADLVPNAGETEYTITIATGVTVTISGWTSNKPIYHSDGQWRIYGGSSVVIASSGENITRIVFTSTQNNLSTSQGTYSDQTWTGDASSVTFINSATQSRITGISITIGEAGTTTYSTDADCRDCDEPTLTFGAVTDTAAYVGDAPFIKTAVLGGTHTLNSTIVYSSNKNSKATVNSSTGQVTILDATSNEPVTITATVEAADDGLGHCQRRVTASYTLTIYNHVTWSVNGISYTTGNPTTQTTEGGIITAYPTDPDGSSACGGKAFVGWTNAPVTIPQATAPATLYTSLESMSSVHITDNTTFYAVFVEQSGDPDVYRKGTLSDLTNGQSTVIVNPAASQAMSNTGSGGSLTALTVSFNGSGKIENPNASLIWTVEKDDSRYKFKNGYYVYAYSTSSIYCDDDDATYTDYWTITASGSNYVMYSNRSTSSNYLECYNGYFKLYSANTTEFFLMDFYVPDVSYSDYTTTCGPNIKANAVEYLTSYKDQTVLSDSIVVRGSSLTANGTLTPSISGTNAGLFTCTLVSNSISAAGAIESKFVIRYTPTAYGNAQHEATLTFSDGTTTSDPVTLRGRSLPEHFAIVAYDGASYYVLDGTMSGSASTVKPLPVTVTDGVVDLCPSQAVYTLTDLDTPDRNVHLVGPTGRRLYGGSDTGLNTHTGGSTAGTGWLLSTDNFNTYHITNATTTTRGIMYNSTHDVFGHYATNNYTTANYYGNLLLLPITAQCTCLPKPVATPVAKANSATLTWEAIEGAASYAVTCSAGSVTVDGTTATITGLASNTEYTFTVKAVASSGTDCSLTYNGSFTTTDCDDVPHDLRVTPGIKSATIKWEMEAATAKICVYSDRACTSSVGSAHTGQTSPAVITDLTENTKYYFKIFAGEGETCSSALDSFLTNPTSIEIAEWFTDSIRISLDSDDDARVVIEDKNENHETTTSYADKLFISKYFEADGNNKMIAIYNGTKDPIDITNMWLKRSERNNPEKKFCLKNFGKTPGTIAPNEEIIIMRYTADNDPAKTCAQKEENYDEWNIIPSTPKADQLDGEGNNIYTWLQFSGPQSIGLYDGNANRYIDIIGSCTVAGTGSLVQINASTDVHCTYTENSNNDGSGFYANGKDIRDGSDIVLSTNRCLLIRKNSVKSGDDAVAQNVYSTQQACNDSIGKTFHTLGDEWVGFIIGKGSDAAARTCEGLAYVGGFDYQKYYAKFDSISGLNELSGKRNDDGTYTVPIPQLDTLSCTLMKVKVYEGNVEKASREYKVPIMVEDSKTTKDTIFINSNPNQLRTAKTCKECDVVILKGGTLTKALDTDPLDADSVRNLTIYPGGTLIVPEGANYNYHVNSIQFRVQEEETPTAKLKGALRTADGQVIVSRRTNNDRYVFFSLPYDCNVSDIRWSNGETPVRGTDYEILEYDAERRAAEGSTKGAPGHWKPAGSVLKAGVGYNVATNSMYLKELIFPMTIGGANANLTEIENTKTTNKVALVQNTSSSSSINNHNWNLVAHPYVSPFNAYSDGKITAGYLECTAPATPPDKPLGDWVFKETSSVYLTMPSFSADKITYEQTLSSTIVKLDPFLAVFVQAVSEGDLTFAQSSRKLTAPARFLAAKAEDEDESIFVGVNLSGNGQTDQTSVRIRPDFTNEYQLGYDLQKFTTYYTTKPQIYMKPADLQLAFQAVSDSVAKTTWMPMGVYCYNAGTYTFSLNENYPIDEVEAVYLQDKTTGTTTNLLYNTYTITTTKQLYTNARFSLQIIVNRKAPEIATDIPEMFMNESEGVLRKILINGHVYIQRGAELYDITGKQLR